MIDDFSVLAVEARLIQQLPKLLEPETILAMEDEVVSTIAAEDAESLTERTQCNDKLRILEEGLKELTKAHQDRANISEGMKFVQLLIRRELKN